jgi:hypothetical protein
MHEAAQPYSPHSGMVGNVGVRELVDSYRAARADVVALAASSRQTGSLFEVPVWSDG